MDISKAENYLKNLKHPEIENYGLNCDTQLWVDFNKELRLREIMQEERETLNHLFLLQGLPQNCNFEDVYNEYEYLYGHAKLALLIEKGKINKLTYEREEK